MALALADAGADVVCAARSLDQIERRPRTSARSGGAPSRVSTDVRDSAPCDAMVAARRDEFGRIDIMLSNAGIGDMRAAGRELWDV